MSTSLDKYLPFADQETPKPAQGEWMLLSPDDRVFVGASPLECLRAEADARIPPEVALGRIARAAQEEVSDAASEAEALRAEVDRLKDAASKAAARGADAERWRGLQWHWEDERDSGPGGRWWCSIMVSKGRPTVEDAIAASKPASAKGGES